MPTERKPHFLKNGLYYSGALLLCVSLIFANPPAKLLHNMTHEWITLALIPVVGFSMSGVVWFIDGYLPQLVGESARRKQFATMIGWLVAAAGLALTFWLMSRA